VDDATLKLFRQFLVDQKIDAADADFAAPGVLDWVKASIKGELFTSVFGQVEGTKVRVEWDPSVQKAITFLPEAQTLEDHAHQAMLQSESVASTQ